MAASPLARRLADEIRDLIESGRLPPGMPLRTQRLAEQFGVSRSPIREAMALLTEANIVEQQANRGFFVCQRSDFPLPADHAGAGDPEGPFDDPYHRLAADWLANHIPAEVTEPFLRTRYGLTRNQLSDVLVQAVFDGWAEPKPGYGWRFLAVAKTPEAFEQIYRFRMLIEPAAMLEPGFKIDRPMLADLRATQEAMINSDLSRLKAEHLLRNGFVFHEQLVRMSGNPLFYRSIQQLNRMRRLLEGRARVDRARLITQCGEHLEILALLERGEVYEASYHLRRHLDGALSRKSPVILQSTQPAGGRL